MDWEVKHYPMYYAGVKQVYPNVPPGSPRRTIRWHLLSRSNKG